MDTIKDLHQLLIRHVRDHYAAELLQLGEWPNLQNTVSSPRLKAMIGRHIQSTDQKRFRLKSMARRLQIQLHGASNSVMEEMLESGWELVGGASAEVIDAGLTTTFKQILHYQLAGYAASKELATALMLDGIAELLQLNIDELIKEDKQLKRWMEDTRTASVHLPALRPSKVVA